MVAGLALALAGWCHAEAPANVEEVLKLTAEKAAVHKDWSADLVQSIRTGVADMEQRGTIQFRSPLLMRMHITMDIMGQPMTTLVVAGEDGIAWSEVAVAGQKQVIKMDLKKMMQLSGGQVDLIEKANPAEQIEKFKKIFELQVKEGDPLAGQPMYVLEGTKKPGVSTADLDQQMAAMINATSRIRILIGKQDGFPHRTELLDEKGGAMFSQNFTNLKFNQNPADDLFRYTPPEGVAVMDMTRMFEPPGVGSPPAEKPATE